MTTPTTVGEIQLAMKDGNLEIVYTGTAKILNDELIELNTRIIELSFANDRLRQRALAAERHAKSLSGNPMSGPYIFEAQQHG